MLHSMYSTLHCIAYRQESTTGLDRHCSTLQLRRYSPSPKVGCMGTPQTLKSTFMLVINFFWILLKLNFIQALANNMAAFCRLKPSHRLKQQCQLKFIWFSGFIKYLTSATKKLFTKTKYLSHSFSIESFSNGVCYHQIQSNYSMLIYFWECQF